MKKIFLIITGILLFVSVPVIVFFFGQQQDIRMKAAPATTLSIQPNVPTIPIGETVVCKIMINTGGNRVATAKVSLAFDATKFEAQSITNGPLAPRILNQGTVGAGTATITVGAQSNTNPISGQGEIATLRLKAIGGSTQPVQVRFASDTFIAGLGENTVNVLVSNQAGSITITGGDPVDDTPATSPSTQPTQPAGNSPTPTTQAAATSTPTQTPAPTPTQPVSALPDQNVGEPDDDQPIGGDAVGGAAGEEIPETGSTEMTLLLSLMAVGMVSAGIVSFVRSSSG